MLELTGAADTAEAIKRLAVRGAPLIGVAAAYGLAMEVAAAGPRGARGGRPSCCAARGRPRSTSPGRSTASRAAALAAGPVRLAGAARAEAEAIEREDVAASAALARHGADALEAVLPAGRPARS